MRPRSLPTLNCRRLLALGSAGLAASLGVVRSVDAEELRDPGPAGIGGYVLAVFPYLPPSSLDRRFAPIVSALRERIGQPVHLRTKSDLEAFAVEVAPVAGAVRGALEGGATAAEAVLQLPA